MSPQLSMRQSKNQEKNFNLFFFLIFNSTFSLYPKGDLFFVIAAFYIVTTFRNILFFLLGFLRGTTPVYFPFPPLFSFFLFTSSPFFLLVVLFYLLAFVDIQSTYNILQSRCPLKRKPQRQPHKPDPVTSGLIS